MSTLVLLDMETTPTTLTLKPAPPPPSDDESSPEILTISGFGNKGFPSKGVYDNTLHPKSFFAAPPCSDRDSLPEKMNNSGFRNEGFTYKGVYDNTLYPKSFFSLDLCTENLGSESGSDMSSPPYSPSISGHNSAINQDNRIKGPRRKTQMNFPPPLTTMSGASTIQVQSRREEGRLIMEAVEAPFKNSYLHTERRDGRLKLSFPMIATGMEEEEAEGEMEIEKIQWLSRCKERSHDWKPSFWLITS